jgi:hypothetical protein
VGGKAGAADMEPKDKRKGTKILIKRSITYMTKDPANGNRPTQGQSGLLGFAQRSTNRRAQGGGRH